MIRVRTKRLYADAVQVSSDMKMVDAEALGLKWDEDGFTCGRRGLYTTDGLSNIPVPIGYWLVTYENGDRRVFPTAGFDEIFEEAPADTRNPDEADPALVEMYRIH